MNAGDRVWPYSITALAAVAVVVVLLDLSFPLRAPLVLAFALVAPGMAVVRLLRLDDARFELFLAVVVSLALAGVLASVAVYLGAWNPRLIVLALVELTLVAVAADLIRRT